MSRLLFTFPSSHAAMEAELVVEGVGVAARLIPLPASISAGCGLVLLCAAASGGRIQALLCQHHIPFEATYLEEASRWTRQP